MSFIDALELIFSMVGAFFAGYFIMYFVIDIYKSKRR